MSIKFPVSSCYLIVLLSNPPLDTLTSSTAPEGRGGGDADATGIGRNSRREGPWAHLERLLACVYQLVPLQLRALHERLAALGAHVHARAVRVQVLPHGRVVAEHLGAALSAGGNR